MYLIFLINIFLVHLSTRVFCSPDKPLLDTIDSINAKENSILLFNASSLFSYCKFESNGLIKVLDEVLIFSVCPLKAFISG